MRSVHFILFHLFLITSAYTSPAKKYLPNEGHFQPSNRYYETNLPNANSTQIESKAYSKDDRPRFGLPISYGNTGNGGGNTGMGYMINPVKIDIGGIALGALIGLGAILIVPKLATVFSGGYGYRSLENDMSSVTDVLARIDNSLEENNIDSSSCMQRIICTYVNEAQTNLENGEANTVDQLIYSLSTNPLFGYLLDGTAVKQAIEMGKHKETEKCANLYMKCPISKENLIKVIASLLPA